MGEPASTTPKALTFRSVVICLLLAAVFGYCIPIIDFKFSNTFLGAMHMPAGAVAVLLTLLVVVNPLLKVLALRAAFSRNEILTIYITCLFSCLVPGRGAENFFVPNVLSSFYFANPENKWLSFLQPHLKSWMTPALDGSGYYNAAAVQGWYQNTGGAIPWAAWLLPILAWSTLILAIQWMHACIAVMLRAQWAEREALAFPLLRLPLEMSEDADDKKERMGKFFRNPAVWLGFAIAVFIELLNGLNKYFPDVPAVPLGLNTGQFFLKRRGTSWVIFRCRFFLQLSASLIC